MRIFGLPISPAADIQADLFDKLAVEDFHAAFQHLEGSHIFEVCFLKPAGNSLAMQEPENLLSLLAFWIQPANWK